MGDHVSVVTGGSGFIGSHVVRQLVAQGDEVRVLDLNAPAPDLTDQVDFRKGSILDPAAVGAALEGATRLFHLAANPNLWARDKSQLAEVNFHGTKTVLAAAAACPLARIVVTSTETILKSYQDKSAGPISETSPLPALEALPGHYSRSKMQADMAAREAIASGLPITIVNPTVPVGEGDISFTPPTKMILGFVDGSTPAYLDCVLNLIAVQDVAAGHILAAEKGRVGERYILSGENVGLGRVLELLEQITGNPMPKRKVPYWLSYTVGVVSEFLADHVTGTPPIAPLEGVRVAGTPMSFDNSKARNELGLELTPLEDALRQSVDWLRGRRPFGQLGANMSYQDHLDEVEARLKKAAEGIPKKKADERAFFMKVKMPMLGLTVPQQRAALKKGYAFSGAPLEDQLPIWDFIWRNARTHEGKIQAGFYLGSLKPIADVGFVWSVTKSWPDTMNCWDQSDEVSKAYSYMYEQKPGLLHPQYKKWNTDENPWRRRQSVVGLFCYAALHKTHPPVRKVLPLVKALLGDDDYYVQKGVGWTLRETYNVYPDDALEFILKHVGDIHPDAFSAAIEKMTPAEKQQVKARRKELRKPTRRK